MRKGTLTENNESIFHLSNRRIEHETAQSLCDVYAARYGVAPKVYHLGAFGGTQHNKLPKSPVAREGLETIYTIAQSPGECIIDARTCNGQAAHWFSTYWKGSLMRRVYRARQLQSDIDEADVSQVSIKRCQDKETTYRDRMICVVPISNPGEPPIKLPRALSSNEQSKTF